MICLLAACARRPIDPGAAREALMAADRGFDSTTAARGLEGWVSFFADSGLQVPDRGDFIVGHGAIRSHMQGLFADTTLSLRWEPDRADASADGSLGYTIGHWRMLARPAGTEVARGHYLTAWRKQPDGSWKVTADIGNQQPAS
jgi:ketosteroid isomerase-like protein